MASTILLLLSLLSVTASPSATFYSSSALYSQHCSSSIPESQPVSSISKPDRSFHLSSSFISGDDPLLAKHSFYINFSPRAVLLTRTIGTLKIEADLVLRGSRAAYLSGGSGFGFSRQVTSGGKTSLRLSGFWLESSGMLCMVGSGRRTNMEEGINQEISALFQIILPKSSNISTSLVGGTLQSLDVPGSPNHFQPIRLYFYAPNDYRYTQIPQAGMLGVDSLDACYLLRSFGGFEMVYGDNCRNRDCGPFNGTLLQGSADSLTLRQAECSWDGKVHFYLGFQNATIEERNTFLFNSSIGDTSHISTTLVGEGSWDESRKRFSLVACRAKDWGNTDGRSAAYDCTIGVMLEFSHFISIRNRSFLAGEIFSSRNDFQAVQIREADSSYYEPSDLHNYAKYKYTMLEDAKKVCSESNSTVSEGKTFPDKHSLEDLSFQINVKDRKGISSWGHAKPRAIGETIIGGFRVDLDEVPNSMIKEMNKDSWKISYWMLNESRYPRGGTVDISAEGYYNYKTGLLCLVGCRSKDCQIGITIQLAPKRPLNGERTAGTISSRRQSIDPLYFQPLNIISDSLYGVQASRAIWRMDAEIIIVVVSMTLSCLLIRKQILHAKKHSQAAASVSLFMLLLLALGLMVPLVLNFQAVFVREQTLQAVMFSGGGWLEANETIVRMTMMIALLLQLRLVQVIWSARSTGSHKKDLFAAERKAIQLCLPLYLLGYMMAWYMRFRSSHAQARSSYSATYSATSFLGVARSSLWECISSFVGLVLDGFLLPQIVLNALVDHKEVALSRAYYVGTTIIRVAPHVYDAYRARSYLPHFDDTFIYADPKMDVYSTVSNIVIPMGSALFAVVIYLQQKFGGRCILPQYLRRYGGYAVIPGAV